MDKTLKWDPSSINDRTAGLFLMCAVGDAKGIPFEMKTYEEIQAHPGRNKLYAKCTDHPLMPVGYGPGKQTDDTQLTCAMARAIMKANCVNMEVMAEEHIKEWQISVAGWGGTKKSIEKLSRGIRWSKTGRESAIGNGVMMKMCPLAFFYAFSKNYNKEEQLEEISTLTKMTHGSPSTLVTTALFTKFAEYLYSHPSTLDTSSERKDFLKKVIGLAEEMEQLYIPKTLEDEEWISKSQYNDYDEYLRTVKAVSPQLKQLLANFSTLTDQKLISISNGGGFFCVDSLVMIIGLLMRKPPTFEVILDAVYIGGDTDSNAAMIGGIIGGMKGLKGLEVPEDRYITQLVGWRSLLDLSQRFAKLFNA
eukprot:CAMPEP_0168523456 /NCGR_PEP_ID=MMETSP0405-20121227/9994_1 /TAXON_ID=498012 /ORGANISM="Trichosphaerium sp, Strain Am-I-7 wt" /LENGTH=362 /DNA_ID=CAMNT_0008545333 /DNA_START=160 /DNA_END=1248 /DNA_ORIENTATION=+